jgi:orotate phosphoribosyltransferase
VERGELARLIKEAAYLEGDFVLRSGKRSTYYLDKYRFETQPAILAAVGQLLAARRTPQTTHLAGAELGGVPLAAATSLACGLPYIIVRNARKDYGTGNEFEGIVPESGTVMLVEDIATTGGQVLEAARALSAAGLTVEKIVAVIDRLEGARQNVEQAGFRFESLLTSRDLGITPPSEA